MAAEAFRSAFSQSVVQDVLEDVSIAFGVFESVKECDASLAHLFERWRPSGLFSFDDRSNGLSLCAIE